MSRCAVLGLGAMGSRVARRLLLAGHDVTVWNRSPDAADSLRAAGARVERTPREAAASSEFVISMLTDDHAARAVWMAADTGVVAGMNEGAIAIEQSTVTPAWVEELGAALGKRGVFCVDAPVVGSRPQADSGQLVHLVGGRLEDVTRVSAILAGMGSALHHMGPLGSGAAMKLLVNALFGIQVAALGELMGVAERSRIGASRLLEVMPELAVTSPALKGAMALIAARNFAPLFPLALVEKDIQYAVGQAQKLNAPAPLTAHALEVFSRACNSGYGAENITAVTKLFA
jgi:3-hydroxyisobutyrate dehydrogenase-like beta-hydroxyacid dehydrogenase